MLYAIEYEHLRDKLVYDEKSDWYFNQVKNSANKYKLELSDEDFIRFLKLEKKNFHADGIMNKMNAYDMSLLDTLISIIN